MDKLIEHVRSLRGSHQLADDFSIIEVRFNTDRASQKTENDASRA
jgi:hypothetical protein